MIRRRVAFAAGLATLCFIIYGSVHTSSIYTLTQERSDSPSPEWNDNTESHNASSSISPSTYWQTLSAQLQQDCKPITWWSRLRTSKLKSIVPAYLLAAHDDDSINGLAELLGQLYHRDDVFVIHIDAKVEEDVFNSLVASIPAECQNIKFVEKRINVWWASFEIVEMERQMLKTALEMDMHWDTAMTMDGTCRPLTTRAKRQEWLQSFPADANSVRSEEYGPLQSICLEGGDPAQCSRTPARCLDDPAECKVMSHTPGNNIVLKGQQWTRLSRPFVEYLFSNDPTVKEWTEFFSKTWFADEHYFQTVFYSSPFNKTAVVENHIWTDWEWECKSHANLRPNESPCYLGANDFEQLAIRPEPFARKFHAGEVRPSDIVQKRIGA